MAHMVNSAFALSTTRLQIAYFRSNVRQRIHFGFDGGLSQVAQPLPPSWRFSIAARRWRRHTEKFRVWITGQVRRVTRPIRREMKRRAAVEPVIGHTKAEHRLGRNYLKGRDGDRSNAVLAAAGHNFSLLLRWLARLLRALIRALLPASLPVQIG